MPSETISIVIDTRAQDGAIKATITGLDKLRNGIEASGAKLVIFSKVLDVAARQVRELFSGTTIRDALAQADAYGKLSQKVGVTTEAFSKLAFAAAKDNISAEKLQQNYKAFAEWLGKAGKGTTDFSEEIIKQAAEFAALDNGAAKARLAVERFGRSGADMIPLLNNGADSMRAMMKEAERLGVVTDKQAKTAQAYEDSLTELKVAVTSLSREVGVGFINTNTAMVHSLTDAAVAMRKFVELHPEVVELGKSLAQAGLALAVVAAVVKGMPAICEMATKALTELNLAIMALTAVGFAMAESFKLTKALLEEERAALATAAANEKLAASIVKTAEARAAAGQVSATELLALKSKVGSALGQGGAAGSAALQDIAKGMIPQGAPAGDAKLTREQYDLRKQLIQLDMRRLEFQRQDRLSMQQGLSEHNPLKAMAKEKDLKAALLELDAKRMNKQKEMDSLRAEAVKSGLLSPAEEKEDALKSEQQVSSDLQSSLADSRRIDPHSFADQFRTTMREIEREWGTWATQMASAFHSVFNSAIQSISSGITGLIIGTKDWGEALQEIGISILTTVVQAIVQMGVRWVATQLMMAIAGKSIAAAGLAATAAIAEAHAAVWAVPAYLASVATEGQAAVTGLAALEAGQATALAGALIGGFAEGGVVPGGPQVIRVNEYGEEAVLNAKATAALGKGNIDSLNKGQVDFSKLKMVLAMQNPVVAAAAHMGQMVSESRVNRVQEFLNTSRTVLSSVVQNAVGPYGLESRVAGNMSLPGSATSSQHSLQMARGEASRSAAAAGGGEPMSVHLILVDSRNAQAVPDFIVSSKGRAMMAEVTREQKLQVGIRR